VAFPLLSRVLSVSVALGCGGWLAYLWLSAQPALHSRSAGVWFVAAQVMLSGLAVFIVRSRTRLGRLEIRQTWVGDKVLPMAELSYGRLIRVRRLEWLIAPRLYLRTLSGKFTVFYVATPMLWAEAERMLSELAAFRKL
jgi:hypothetical protein